MQADLMFLAELLQERLSRKYESKSIGPQGRPAALVVPDRMAETKSSRPLPG